MLEVEVSRSVVDRLGLFSVLGAKEVWRVRADGIQVLLLGTDGQYAEGPTSRAFPFLSMERLQHYLALRWHDERDQAGTGVPGLGPDADRRRLARPPAPAR